MADKETKKRHSLELEVSSEKDPRPYKYVLEGDRPLLPRQRFYNNRLHTLIQFKETKAAFLVAIKIYTDGSTNKIMYSGKLH